jgi:calcium-dependent protein kinase
VLARLRAFHVVSKFQKTVLNILVKTIDPAQLSVMRQIFVDMDKDGNGLISASELKSYLRGHHILVGNAEAQAMVEALDTDGNQFINYSEFLAATIDVQKFLTEQRMHALFDQFDTDADGIISNEDVINAFMKLGHSVSSADVAEMTGSSSNHITFEEFKNMMTNKIEEKEKHTLP